MNRRITCSPKTVFDASLSLAMGGELTTIPDAVSTFLRNVNAVTNPTMHPVSAAEAMMRARYVDTFAHPDVIRVSGDMNMLTTLRWRHANANFAQVET
jgi:hypothetical protein